MDMLKLCKQQIVTCWALTLAAGFLGILVQSSSACGSDDTAAMLAAATPPLADTALPPTARFPVLANAAVTCTNGSFTGDVGTFLAAPTGAVTETSCAVSGTVHVGDASAKEAFSSFLISYAALARKQSDSCAVLTGTLAGVTLSPGLYCFDAAATVTGLLTLNGPESGVWIFKIGTTTGALTGTNFSMVMTGGGRPCNVVWWVAEAATMTTSTFLGSILAGAAITMTGGTMTGNALAKADLTTTGTRVTGCASN